MKENIESITNKTTQRMKEKTNVSQKGAVITRKLLQSNMGPTFKETMSNIKEKCVEVEKSKDALEKHVETRRQKKQRLENKRI
jgi:hypothetical protein